MALIDDFLDQERRKGNYLVRLLRDEPKAYSTQSLASDRAPSLGTQKIIRPSLLSKLIAAGLLLYASFFWMVLFEMLFKDTVLTPVTAAGLLFVSFLIFLIVRRSFFNRKYIYKILLTRNYIQIGGLKISWKEIEDTFIINEWGSKAANSSLLLFKKDGSIKRSDLSRFSISNEKLATIIEYYKLRSLLSSDNLDTPTIV